MKISLSPDEVKEILGEYLECKMGVNKEALLFKPLIDSPRKNQVGFEVHVLSSTKRGD